jgi:hypothetical protein
MVLKEVHGVVNDRIIMGKRGDNVRIDPNALMANDG